MSTQTIHARTITCDRCGYSTSANEGPRESAKPLGWGRITVWVKLVHKHENIEASPARSVGIDICPKCVTAFENWLAQPLTPVTVEH